MPTLSGVVGTFKTLAELNTLYPPVNWSGRVALIEGPPSYEVYCDGVSWTPRPAAVGYGLPVLSQGTSATITAANTTILQAALSAGGDVRIVTPGIYNFNVSGGPMTLPSNTSLYVGAGVRLRVADGSPSALFTNSTARSTGVVALAANVSYATAPDGNNFVATVANMTAANAALFPVDSFVSVVVLGHGALGVQGTAWAGRGYRGVRRVVAQTINGGSSSIQYLIDPIFPGSAPSTNNITIFQANENIAIYGPGTIDGNGSLANQSFNTGDPRGCILWWRHAYNLVVEGLKFNRGVTWSIGSNYVRNYKVRNCTMELRNTPAFATVDFVHLSGNHQNVLIEDIEGGAGDNAVGMTIDCTEGTAYDFPYQSPGDMYDITVRRMYSESICEDGFFGIVAMYGPAAYWYRNVVIESITGQGSAAVQLSNYTPTNQNKLQIDRLQVSNLRATAASSQIEITAGAVIDIGEFICDGIITIKEEIPVYRAFDTASGNIRSLVFRNPCFFPFDGAAFSRTASMIRLGGPNVNALQVSNMEGITQAINVRAIEAGGPGNIPKVGIRDCSATGSGTGAGLAALWADTGAGTAAAPVYNNSTSNGTAL